MNIKYYCNNRCSGFGGKVEGIMAPLEYAGTFLSYTKGSETDEMRPQWFSTTAAPWIMDGDLPAIPYDMMWGSEKYWLPYVMEKRIFLGRADFVKEDTYQMRKWWCGIPPAPDNTLPEAQS
ncbi:hypothetical protein BDQ17DRAFT_1344893 [Cyathus striatus]|nr:hypothetical protein BDQ17DRAFT_1344893 [Cyathus striatus]